MDKRIGNGRYRLLQPLGEGAFSRVYLAEDGKGGLYACKICENPEALRREADYQRRLRHPLFPYYVEEGEEGGRGFLIMEYVRGETLERAVGREGAFGAERAARIGMELAEGLRYLHEGPMPLVYRDLKPANILLEETGRVRLLDLGCVCPAGETGSVAGTPGFGAPEQFVPGGRQEAAADLYGLGKILLMTVGGKCRGPLKEVILACTAEEPGERLPDMRTLLELLAVCRKDGSKGRFDSVQKAWLRGGIRVRKNIWEYGGEKA
ncbi:MAG: serine/threonine protein kinase [bacterium]|nr:serine/threonine protein kinase [bacterium]